MRLIAPQGPIPTTTERGLRFLRPQLRDVPWWRLTLEGDTCCLAYILPEPNRADPIEPVAAALWATPTAVFWAAWKPLPALQGETEQDFFMGLRILIDTLRDVEDPGYPAAVALVVSEREGTSERVPTVLSETAQLLLLALAEEGAVRVQTALQAANEAATTRLLRWPRPPPPPVLQPTPIPEPPHPKTIRRPRA